MTLYQKTNGVWVAAQRPYVKRNGAWVAAQEAYVKRSGVWVRAYAYVSTPPPAPEITLEIVEAYEWTNGVQSLKTRYLKVGTRIPGGAHNPNIQSIKMLTTFEGAQPTTQFGGTYWSTPDDTYPNEPWSLWKYASFGWHEDTSNYQYKQFPVNAAAGTLIGGNKTHYFSAWSLDTLGNWSTGTHASIFVPPASVNSPQIVVKEANFQANSSGTFRGDTNVFQGGGLLQQRSPRAIGLWFYGNQLTDSIGAQTTKSESIKVRRAEIHVVRDNDNGQANANVNLFWFANGTAGSLPTNGPVKQEITTLGQIAKGQSKWFALPQAFLNNLNTGIRGMGLDWKKPGSTDAVPADYSRMYGIATNPGSGKVHVVWEEEV